MKSLPENVAVYRRTPDYTESTVPASFIENTHTTKAGVWCRICVAEGSLRYRVLEPTPEDHVLTPGHSGVVEPEVPHEVELIGKVRFCIEFLRPPSSPAA